MLAIADIAVIVSNARASARWWKKNLGFGSYTVGGKGHALLVAPPGERFVLHLCEGFAPLEPGDTGIAFVTDEMETLFTKMTKNGVRFPVPPKKEAYGAMAKFEDPDGNIFWLLNVPRSMVRATIKSRAPLPRTRKSRARRRPRAR